MVRRVSSTAANGKFVGRHRELELVRGRIQAAIDGEGSVVILQGESGIGKTAFADMAAEEATQAGMIVCAAAAEVLERGRPLNVVSELLAISSYSSDPRRQDLSAILEAGETSPSGVSPGAPPAPGRLLEGVGLLAEAQMRRSCMFVADDTHWADLWSLAGLRRMARLVRHHRAILLLVSRTATDPDLARLHDALIGDGAATIELEPLRPAEVNALATEWLGGTPGPRVRALLGRAHGHPLFITEMLRGLEPERFERNAGRVDVGGEEVPESVQDVIRSRVARLDADTRELVQQASILGARFPAGDLATLTGRSPMAMAPLVDRAIQAHVLAADGGGLHFTHELVRDVVYQAVPKDLRASVHREAAVVLAASGAPKITAARHLALGASKNDLDAIERVRAAAVAARANDPPATLELLNLARDLATDQALRDRIDRDRAIPLAWTGQFREGSALLARAIETATGDERAELRWLLSGVKVLQLDIKGAQAELESAVKDAEDGTIRAQLLAELAMALLLSGSAETNATAKLAVEAAEAASDAPALSLGLSILARALCTTHCYAEARVLTERAVAVAEHQSNKAAHFYVPWFYHGLVLLDLDDLSAARDALVSGRERAGEIGTGWAPPLYAALEASIEYRAGNLMAASAAAQDGVEMAEDTGSVLGALWCLAIDALISLGSGDGERARQLLHVADRYWTSGRALLGVDYYFLARALLAEHDGQADVAAKRLKDAWDLFGDLGVLSCQPTLGADLARLAATGGEFDTAEAVGVAMSQAAERSGVRAFAALAARSKGHVERDPELLAQAEEAYRRDGRKADAALTRADRVHTLFSRGHRRAARELADRAAPELSELGLDAYAADLSQVRSRPLVPLVRDDPWAALTPSESGTVELVGEGLTNAEIAERRGVSVRTVESHLHRAYTKLDVGSRTELALAAVQR